MSAPRPGVPVTETLGDDGPPPRRGRWVTAGLAVVGLVAAFALGLESRGVSVGGVSLVVDPPELAAGALRASGSSGAGVGLVLPVHNTGTSAVDAAVTAAAGLVVRRASPVRLPAGEWTVVPFTVEVDCRAVRAGPATVTLSTGTSGTVELDLAEQSSLVPDLHDATCGEQQSLTPGRLAGVWLLERAFGRWSELAGRHVLQFRRDGSFVADPEGVRFTSHRGVLGRYRLRGPLLDAVEQGFVGYACLPGERALWRAGQLRDGRVVLRFVRGRNCPDQPGELWVLRRVAR